MLVPTDTASRRPGRAHKLPAAAGPTCRAICEDAEMTSPPDPYSTDAYALLDAGVLRAMADALDGRWSPDQESDPLRRQELLDAARLRLYGERDRSGWYLVSYREAREAAVTRGDTDWSVGFIPDVDEFDDSPGAEEVAALVRLYRDEDILAEASTALAHAVLYEPVRFLVTTDVRPYKHSRDLDLPERLELVEVHEAGRRTARAAQLASRRPTIHRRTPPSPGSHPGGSPDVGDAGTRHADREPDQRPSAPLDGGRLPGEVDGGAASSVTSPRLRCSHSARASASDPLAWSSSSATGSSRGGDTARS
ncbi:MAG: hypothetical protein U5R31_06275 [Acidimicrobiia bacterium]|nr:hypothetical protein [Acidimicrobiia bacterium]